MAAPKKFVIKSFRNQNVMDSSGAQKTWSTLEAAIDEIYNQNASALSFEELYRSAYNLVLNKFGDLLYTGVANAVKRHLQEAILVVVETPKDKLHAAISKAWNDHKITMNMVKDILMYMDRTYAVEHKKAPVYNMSILIFREVVVYHTEVRERMRALLLENIENERNGYLIDKDLMKGLLTMLGELSVDGANVYEEEFEKHFLDMTRAFYRHESQSYLSESNCSDFIRKADARLTEEAVRVRQYLSAATEPKLKHLMEYEYISTHAQALVEMETSGCQYMFKEDKLEDLKMMYNLFSRVPSTLDFIRDSLSEYVKKAGLEIVADQETVRDPIQFVQRMLELKEKFDKIIKESFRDDKKFLKRLKEAFESFINKDTRCAAHLASYVDDLLKSGLKGMSESDVEAHLDRVIVLFHYLSDKDIFEDMYRNHLTKRLLNNRSVSDDTEKLMISKLKSECGQQFTSKMEGMFLDMNMSKEIMEAYKGTQMYTSCPVDMEVQTLTASHWNLKPIPPCILPPLANDCCDRFTAFYLDRYKSGRRLAWLTQVGSVDLRANYKGGRKELNVSTYQMCLLAQFNDMDVPTLSLSQLRDATNIPETELRRHLLSLCTPKLRILCKSSKVKGIEDNETFTYNADFTSKLKRIKVPLISVKEVTVEEATEIPPTVEEDRRHLVEASIVRAMKSRKKLSHNELIAEITRQLSIRFTPTPQYIKKRVESLIEREYLARDKDDPRMYFYLA